MMVAVGTSSCSSSSRFGASSTFKVVTPVRLPPGRFRLATSPSCDRVDRYLEDDRNRRGRRLCRQRRRSAAGRGNHGHLTANQIGRQRRQSIVLAVRPAIFDRDVLALDIAGFASGPGGTRADGMRVRVRRCAAEEPDHRHRRLLRARRERPRSRRAAEQRDELAPSDADCHLTRPQWDHIRCNVGKNSTPQDWSSVTVRLHYGHIAK